MANNDPTQPPAGFIPVQPRQNSMPPPPSGFVPVRQPSPVSPQETAEYEGAFKEFGEGVASGLIGIGQGLLELGASGVDLVLDTDTASSVTAGAEAIRKYAGIDPAGFIGKGTEIVTQFVVPGLGAASAVSKMNKARQLAQGLYQGANLTRAQRLGMGAKQLAAAGLVDAAVATDGVTTIGDFFEGGPTQTDQTIGLTGREEALRRITNKFKLGMESAGLGAAVGGAAQLANTTGLTSTVGKALGAGAQVAGAAARPVVNLAGRGLDVVSDVTAGPTSSAIRAAADTGVGQFLGRQNRNAREYLQELERAKTFGAVPGGPGAREGTLAGLRNTAEGILNDTASLLRYRGNLPQDVAVERLLSQNVPSSFIRRGETSISNFDKKLDSAFGKIDEMTSNSSPLHRAETYNIMREYMTTPKAQLSDDLLSAIPKQARQDVKDLRANLDTLRQNVLNSATLKRQNVVNPKTGQDLQTTIEENVDTYLRRRMRIFEDVNYKPSDEVLSVGLNGFKNDPRSMAREIQMMVRERPSQFTDDYLAQLGLEKTGAGKEARIRVNRVTDEAARLARDAFVQRYRPKNRGLFGYKGTTSGRSAKDAINVGMFKERTNIPKYQRALLGEIDDPREQIIATIADLAEFKAVDDYFGRVAQMADNNEGIGRFFTNSSRLAPDMIDDMVDSGNYVVLGGKGGAARPGIDQTDLAGVSEWGPLHGYVVPKRVYDSLTQQVYGGSGNEVIDGIRATYSSFLRAKGASQYGKTVLSPITQLRNVSTASAFAAANGNIGRQASLGDSIRIVMQDLSDMPTAQALDELEEMSNLGVIGTNAQLRELQDIISKGLGFTAQDQGKYGSSAFARRLQDNKLGGFLGSINKKAQDLYQGGDDIWKIYNYKFEQEKIRNALRNAPVEDQLRYLTKNRQMQMTQDQMMRKVNSDPEFLDTLVKEKAADIVRNTVPNYNMVPEAISYLRRTPYGNFVAFPYEILRTGTNIIERGVDELLDSNPEIQKIGMRRLIGASTTFAGVPMGITELAHQLTGVSKEEMDAYRRSFAMPWERNARLIPIGRDENGMPEYINFSYSNPYDMLERGINTVMNEIDAGRRLGKSASEITTNAMGQALLETFRPFMDESILLGKLKDVGDPQSEGMIGQLYNMAVLGGRGGETVTGAKVYREGEAPGDKIGKSLLHILDAFLPGAVPVNIRGGELEPSRALRGLFGSDDPNALIASQDKSFRNYDPETEILRAFTGVTPLTINPERSLYYAGVEYQEAIRNATNLFNTVAYRGDVDAGSLLNAYRRANESRYRAANAFYQKIEDMRQLGLPEPEIRRILRDRRIGGTDMLLQGRFDPFRPSNDVSKRMQQNGTLSALPRREIGNLYNEFRSMRLTSDQDREQERQDRQPTRPATIPAPPPGFQPRSTAPAPAPVPAPAPQPSMQFPAPPPGFQPRQINPSLVPDPRTRDIFNNRG